MMKEMVGGTLIVSQSSRRHQPPSQDSVEKNYLWAHSRCNLNSEIRLCSVLFPENAVEHEPPWMDFLDVQNLSQTLLRKINI